MNDFPNDYTKAHLYHWLHDEASPLTTGLLESEKPPGETRIYYLYNGQPNSVASENVVSTQPNIIARVVWDQNMTSQSQVKRFQYNSRGNITKYTDPVGRITEFDYYADGINLWKIRQTTAGQNQLLVELTYNNARRPLSYIDAARQTTSFSWNAAGQLWS